KTRRVETWVKDPELHRRVVNEKEIIDFPASGPNSASLEKNRISAACQHYAARFAAKEAFSKALGTGIVFDLRDVFVVSGANGKPELFVKNSAAEIFRQNCPEYERAKIFISMSHEKEFVVSEVIIEI
ncbi:MAG: 4'-phosphopantetheinyl transferase superfamily protein, partial [Treponemataceae bacterium]|nr:4'-phosphopantetheinyl transferase superfamily protein [Treponemataceae bacterium]